MDNFLVSARKYRPATFRSVVGQEHITSTLKNAIARGQLAHAYLFCGPRGVGKTTCARIFAKAINCLSPMDNEACGQCESCKAFEQERSMNIHELDAASNNSVDDIRTLTDQVRVPPQIGRYSVYIIDEVHMLSAAAFNAFLKTLEEPPAHAIFILATTEKHKIIPTILSRCQIYDFNRIRVEDAVSYLKYVAGNEGVTADDESLNLIAQKADGGMRDALSMFDKAVSFCGNALEFRQVAQTLNVLDYDVYFGLVETLREGDYAGALRVLDEALRKGFSESAFLAGLNGHLRDLLMCKSEQTLPLLEVAGSLLERYKQQAAGVEVGWLFGAIATLTGIETGLKTALNQRLNVELGLMNISGLSAPTAHGTRHTAHAAASDEAEKLEAKTASQEAGSSEPPQAESCNKGTLHPSAGSEPSNPPPPDEVEKPIETPVPEPIKPAATPISGASLSELMAAPVAPAPAAEKVVVEMPKIDPAAEEKIRATAPQFLQTLQAERPRFAQAFAEMAVEGHRVSVSAASRELHDEIMRARTELMTMLAAAAGVEGTIELGVSIVETLRAAKPIKVEDRLRHLTELNPLLSELRKELDLEVE